MDPPDTYLLTHTRSSLRQEVSLHRIIGEGVSSIEKNKETYVVDIGNIVQQDTDAPSARLTVICPGISVTRNSIQNQRVRGTQYLEELDQ